MSPLPLGSDSLPRLYRPLIGWPGPVGWPPRLTCTPAADRPRVAELSVNDDSDISPADGAWQPVIDLHARPRESSAPGAAGSRRTVFRRMESDVISEILGELSVGSRWIFADPHPAGRHGYLQDSGIDEFGSGVFDLPKGPAIDPQQQQG